MKTLKECKTCDEAIVVLEKIISKPKIYKEQLNIKDEKVLLSNLYYDLDCFLNYEKSKK